MADPAPPATPTEFRPITRRDLQVTRFNRLAIVLVGTLAALVLSAAIYALSSHGPTADGGAGRREATEPIPDPEPWYTRLDPALPVLPVATPPVDSAPPAEPAQVPDLTGQGRPLSFEPVPDGSQREREILERAIASVPAIPNGSGVRVSSTPARGETTSSAGAARSDYFGALDRVLAATGSATAPGGGNESAQAQRENRAFLDGVRGADDGTVLPQQVREAPSPYLLSEGTVIPCVLEGGINSDLPGPIRARVRQNVYDSPTGRFLLIPQGTLVTGEYQSVVAFGQSRVLVAARRLIFPDGSSLLLRGMPLVDLEGYSGFADRVDRHFFRTFGSAVLMAGISAGVQLGQGSFDDDSSISDSESPREILAAALAQQLGEVSSEMIRRNLAVQPTIEIRPGYRFNVFATQDMVLPGPYRPNYATERPQR